MTALMILIRFLETTIGRYQTWRYNRSPARLPRLWIFKNGIRSRQSGAGAQDVVDDMVDDFANMGEGHVHSVPIQYKPYFILCLVC